MISIILLVKNGAKFLPKLFQSLEKQKGAGSFEIVVVDSESTDNSLEIVRRSHLVRGATSIKPSEFGHGKTRNFAIRQAKGDTIVFLSQDALPIDNDWLFKLTRPLSSGAAGVFGRQIPYANTCLEEKYFYSISYPTNTRIMNKSDTDFFSNKKLFFSNVNSAARKDLLIKYPFRDDLIMSEDQFWGREVLRAGYKIVYEPEACVYHSHNYNLSQLFKRYYQSGLSQKQMNLQGDIVKKGLGTGVDLLKYIFKKNPLRLPYSVIYTIVKGGAFMLGRI